MRIILTGGITGGHIYPALAIGDKFKEMDPECEILYIGNERRTKSFRNTVFPWKSFPPKRWTGPTYLKWRRPWR